MTTTALLAAALLAGAALRPVRAVAQDAAAPASSDRLWELERKLDVLSGEIERMKLGAAAEPEARAAKPGAGVRLRSAMAAFTALRDLGAALAQVDVDERLAELERRAGIRGAA